MVKKSVSSTTQNERQTDNDPGGWSRQVKSRADKNGICLCTVEDLPPWHFQHRGIKTGYRYCQSIPSAVVSFSYWHNESINTWSHIIACVFIWAYFMTKWDTIASTQHDSIIDKPLIVFTVLFGNIAPLLSSAFCHSFYCVDKKTHKFCWFLDFFGIISGMMICGFSFIYFSFYCNRLFVLAWGGLMLVIYLFTIYWCWRRFTIRLDAEELIPKDRFPEFSFSLSSFVCIASFIPIAFAWFIQPEHLAHEALYWVLVEATLCPILLSIGVVAFAQGAIPERFLAPNSCDMFGHSHQIWHLVTAAVMFSLCRNTVNYFHARVEHGCGI